MASTKIDSERIVAMWNEGITGERIARQLNLSYFQIMWVLRKARCNSERHVRTGSVKKPELLLTPPLFELRQG